MSRRPIFSDDPDVLAARGQFVGSGPRALEHFGDPTLPPPARGPPQGLELERMLSMPEVCELTGLSPDSVKRHYRHLLRHLSPRRIGMKLKDALSIGSTA